MAESTIRMGQVKHLSTSEQCTITTLDNGVYIYETSYPAAMPSGSTIINAKVRAATIFISWNESIKKMFLWCAVERPLTATYLIDVWYV